MIHRIKLEKEHFGFLEQEALAEPYWSCRIVIAPSWVSNGYWAVHKSLVTNADDFINEETVKKHFQLSEDDELLFLELEDEKMPVLFPETRNKHIKTNEVITRATDYIQFKDYDNDHEAYFNAGYIKLFQITELWGNGTNPYVNTAKGEPTFIIAACNI